MVLSFDTSTEYLVVALFDSDTGLCRASTMEHVGLGHSERLLVAVDELLRETSLEVSDIGLVAAGKGPGSFSGIRIGLATAKGLSQGLGIGVVTISGLDAMAKAAFAANPGDGSVVPVIDARKGRVYAAEYRDQRRNGDYLDVSPGDLLGMYPDALFCGPGAKLVSGTDAEPMSWAQALAELAFAEYKLRGSDEPNSGALYVRASDAELGITSGKRISER